MAIENTKNISTCQAICVVLFFRIVFLDHHRATYWLCLINPAKKPISLTTHTTLRKSNMSMDNHPSNDFSIKLSIYDGFSFAFRDQPAVSNTWSPLVAPSLATSPATSRARRRSCARSGSGAPGGVTGLASPWGATK